jgi:hypothetical protein
MTERFAAFVSVDFDAAQAHPRFHCDQADDRISLRLVAEVWPTIVYVTGTVDELHTFAARIIYALLAHTEDLHHAGAAAREVVDTRKARKMPTTRLDRFRAWCDATGRDWTTTDPNIWDAIDEATS